METKPNETNISAVNHEAKDLYDKLRAMGHRPEVDYSLGYMAEYAVSYAKQQTASLQSEISQLKAELEWVNKKWEYERERRIAAEDHIDTLYITMSGECPKNNTYTAWQSIASHASEVYKTNKL